AAAVQNVISQTVSLRRAGEWTRGGGSRGELAALPLFALRVAKTPLPELAALLLARTSESCPALSAHSSRSHIPQPPERAPPVSSAPVSGYSGRRPIRHPSRVFGSEVSGERTLSAELPGRRRE